MTYAAVTGEPAPPMPNRISAWSIYDLFESKEGESIFIGATSDQQWKRFCQVFGFTDLLNDDRLAGNNQRIDNREWLMPELRKRIALYSKERIVQMAETAGIPFAPVAKPDDLFEDPQLNQGGSLVHTTLAGGIHTKLPKIPLRIGSYDFNLKKNPPAVGEGAIEALESIGLSMDAIEELRNSGVIVLPE
jgi:crotonobetainyl-CoA:carnitine CoA-transferase CaiB-like acyl-CoA transferase